MSEILRRSLLICLGICAFITSTSAINTTLSKDLAEQIDLNGFIGKETPTVPKNVEPLLQSLNYLNGYWVAPEIGDYWIRQSGYDVWWIGTSWGNDGQTWTQIFSGRFDHRNRTIKGIFVNVPRGVVDEGPIQRTYTVSEDGDTIKDDESGLILYRTELNVTQPSEQPVQTTESQVQTIPSYKFVLDSCNIKKTRSAHEDTDYASIEVAVGNEILNGKAQIKAMGDVNDGVHEIGLETGPGEVPVDPNVPVIIAIQIVNSGHTDYSQITNSLSSASSAIIESVAPIPGLGAASSIFIKFLGGIFTANCDGPVVTDKIITNGQELANWTSNGPYYMTKFYPGIDSDWGCGKNSEYDATWHVEKVS